MATKTAGGLYRPRLKDGSLSPWFRVRLAIPADVRPILRKREYDVGLKTDSLVRARDLASEQTRSWRAEIAAARSSHVPHYDMESVEEALGFWALIEKVREGTDPRAHRFDPTRPHATDCHTPYGVIRRVSALRRGLEEGDLSAVPDFGATRDAALERCGIRLSPSHPQWREIERTFARHWLASLQDLEKGRLRGATMARVREVESTPLEMIAVEPAPAPIVPRSDDRTVADLVAAYRADRDARLGAESTTRKYAHIFTALTEVLGAETILRAVKREDCRRVRDFLRRVPVRAAIFYPGLTLSQAVEAGERDKRPTLSPGSVASYLANLNAMLNWAIEEEWITANPAIGLVGKPKPQVKRRGFSAEELRTIFGSLEDHRRGAEPWRWWLAALGLYTGARLNELVQLRASDVRYEQGIAYLAISEFEQDGRRGNKRLKTETSERNVPLHPDLINAGFIAFVGQGSGLIFGAIPEGCEGRDYTASKWWGRHLNSIGYSDPALTFHSFRHGWRDACENVISARLIKYMGGWALPDVGDRYGSPGLIPKLGAEIEKISFGGFALTS